MKKHIRIIIIMGLAVIFSCPVLYAQHMGPGGRHYGFGMGPGYGGWSRMTPEQEEKWRDMRRDFLNETYALRQNLISKQIELQTLWEEDKPDMDKAKALSKEITELQLKIQMKRNELLIQCRDKFGDRGWACPGSNYWIAPDLMRHSWKMGPDMMYYGWGRGPGYGSWKQMDQKQEREFRNMRTRFLHETLSLRQKLMKKQMELQTLWEEDKPDSSEAKKLSDEITELRLELQKKQNEFLIQCRKKFGDQEWTCPGGGYGMGPGMMQRGWQMGPGMMNPDWGM